MGQGSLTFRNWLTGGIALTVIAIVAFTWIAIAERHLASRAAYDYYVQDCQRNLHLPDCNAHARNVAEGRTATEFAFSGRRIAFAAGVAIGLGWLAWGILGLVVRWAISEGDRLSVAMGLLLVAVVLGVGWALWELATSMLFVFGLRLFPGFEV